MTTERELNELTALLKGPSDTLLELAPLETMARQLDAAIERRDVEDKKDAGQLRLFRFWSPLPIAVGVLAVFTIGALIGRTYFPAVPEYTGPPRWITAAVDHTNLYTTETMTSNPLSEDQKAELLASASEHIEKDLNPAANETARAFFQNGDLMGFEGKRLVQLNYLYDDGTPFALYVLRTPETSDDAALANAEFKKGKIDELTAMRWAQPGYEYFAVGRLTREQMDSVAAALSVQLR